jgi:hypothetical protein
LITLLFRQKINILTFTTKKKMKDYRKKEEMIIDIKLETRERESENIWSICSDNENCLPWLFVVASFLLSCNFFDKLWWHVANECWDLALMAKCEYLRRHQLVWQQCRQSILRHLDLEGEKIILFYFVLVIRCSKSVQAVKKLFIYSLKFWIFRQRLLPHTKPKYWYYATKTYSNF